MNSANNNDNRDGGATTWLSAAREEIRRTASPRPNVELYGILRAFGDSDDDAPGPSNLDPDDGGASSSDVLRDRISAELLDEVDADQARMFGRRFCSVSTLLLRGGDEKNGGGRAGAITTTTTTTTTTTDRLLRLALHRRAAQILSETDPVLSRRKAPRVRALVDYVWSQSHVLGLRDAEAANNDDRRRRRHHPTLAQLVLERDLISSSSTHYDEFSPGFRHGVVDGTTSDFGPVHINVLRIDLTDGEGNPAMRMRCADARDATTDLRALAEVTGAMAAISGGFFLYSEPDVEPPSKRTDPVGLLVSDGRVVGPPVFRRAAILQTAAGGGGSGSSIRIDKVGMTGVKCTLSSGRETLGTFTMGEDGARCVHRGSAEEVVVDGNDLAFSIVGSAVVAAHPSPTRVRVPLAGFVLVVPRGALPPDRIDSFLRDVGPVVVSYSLPQPYDGADNAMAGGPMFFSDDGDDRPSAMDLISEDFSGSAPPVTFSQDETHDHNLLPRMGVGIARCADTGREQLVCVAVDGRNLDRALGLTLGGTSDLLRSLGCTTAMNLDGGSSKRMVVWDPRSRAHRVVCLSTTEIKAGAGGENSGNDGEEAVEPSRPVHSAILFLPVEQ